MYCPRVSPDTPWEPLAYEQSQGLCHGHDHGHNQISLIVREPLQNEHLGTRNEWEDADNCHAYRVSPETAVMPRRRDRPAIQHRTALILARRVQSWACCCRDNTVGAPLPARAPADCQALDHAQGLIEFQRAGGAVPYCWQYALARHESSHIAPSAPRSLLTSPSQPLPAGRVRWRS